VSGAAVLAGFAANEIDDALDALGRLPSRAEASPGRRLDAFAAAVWTFLVEPGDAVGGLLREVLGPAEALRLLDRPDNDIRAALSTRGCVEAHEVDLAAARRRWEPRFDAGLIRRGIASARSVSASLVIPGDASWPAGFDDLGRHAPVALWVRGDPRRLVELPSVALVGSRASSAYGEQVVSELAVELSTRGLGIYSGGAYGIDGMAHRAALSAEGVTVAVMAGGVDRFYPAGHHDLLTRVAQSGAVAAEVPCGMHPSRWRFLQRNRVLAAATAMTIVIEAGHRSGALNTAGHARTLGRPLGAVPGPITSPASEGCHRLLRDPEVALVAGVSDVLEAGAPRLDARMGGRGLGERRRDPVELRVLDALSGRQARDAPRVQALSGLMESEVQTTLAVLELTGEVKEVDQGWLRLVR
jgi:DNA processing protein